jgi:hypothetical protein
MNNFKEIDSEVFENILPINIDPENYSVKEVYIDGVLNEKYMFVNNKWIKDVCHYKNCKSMEIDINHLCATHKLDFKNLVYKKGPRRYKRSNNQWVQICNVCLNETINGKTQYCKLHINNPSLYSSQYTFSLLSDNVEKWAKLSKDQIDSSQKESVAHK